MKRTEAEKGEHAPSSGGREEGYDNIRRANDQRGSAGKPRSHAEAAKQAALSAARRSEVQRLGGESEAALFRRITHLHMEKKGLRDLGDSLAPFPNLEVLFCYVNNLPAIGRSLEPTPKLTHLHLQSNELETMEGIGHLHSLRKLHLDNNRINRVAGLEGCTSLEELRLPNQRLEPGEELAFDEVTLASMSHCLTLVDIRNNGVADLSQLGLLKALRTLDARFNQSSRIAHIFGLGECPSLQELLLQGCPVSSLRRVREEVLSLCQHLTSLDGRPVTPREREFISALRSKRRPNSASSFGNASQRDDLVVLARKPPSN